MQQVSQAFDFRHEQTPAHSGDWHFAPPHLSTGKGSEIVVSAVAEVAENGNQSSQRSFTGRCLFQCIYFAWQNNLAGFLAEHSIFQGDIHC